MTQRKDPSAPKPADLPGLGQRIEIADVADPLLHQALAVWNAQRGTARFPTRDAMTPRVMAPFLRNIVLVRAIDDGKDYEFRIVGDAIVQVQGTTLQGLTLTEIDKQLPGYGRALRPIYGALLAAGEPMAWRGRIEQAPMKRAFAHETILLPLGADGTRVDHILVVGVYTFNLAPP
ncbi:MAG TPA: PAS domain-containing protein [Rhizomicrobium sp.]|nr:PAS domain-containing protein [Rhizomicrobium sp.]